ncbi:DUF4071 domain-containing protein [Methylocystis sp. MitZ-2018]|nr:DUF4071 domain-containing protein [Methylocystis sp. MitZ-2018]
MAANPTCFVIMGFGEKTDFETGRRLNLDKTYHNIIKPAVASVGYDCIRADEVLHSGVIDVPMYDWLLNADLVVADLSTSNLNAVFELGVRHALRPKSTIVLAEEGFRSPFDVNHIVIRRYAHLGSDIGYDEAQKKQKELAELANSIRRNGRTDSPVYTVLTDLEPPHRYKSAAIAARGAGAIAVDGELQAAASRTAAGLAAKTDGETYAALLDVAMEAKSRGDFELAKAVLLKIYEEQTALRADGKRKEAVPRIIQELALATYKSGDKALATTSDPGVALAAYQDALALLASLDPETTTDPETLGLWSAIHKRKAELAGRSEEERRVDLDIAILAAERGFLIANDHYTGGNLAYLLDLRASFSVGDDQIADRVLADRVRRRVVPLAQSRLDALKTPGNTGPEATPPSTLKNDAFWAQASLTEALTTLGQVGSDAISALVQSAPESWMADVVTRQAEKLRDIRSRIKS